MKSQKRHQLTVRSKIWLEIDGEAVLGEGRTGLLESIDRLGSITGAANQVGISYRRAWSYLQAMEARLGVKLVETQRGGEHGGGARLTEKARVLIKGYQELLTGKGKEMRKRSKGFF